ncbi:hypothetical protein ACM66B_001161 [Microbotryomycetes sp. NB124-2]
MSSTAARDDAQASTSTATEPVASTSASNVSITYINQQQQQDQPPMSKNAMKRLAKQQKFEATKQERRLKERAKRKQRQAEKRQLAQSQDGDGVDVEQKAEMAAKKMKKSMPKKRFGARIVIDCAFDELMNDREIKSMSSQLGFCYAANKSTTRPFDLMITSLNGRLKARFDALQDKAHESWKNVEWWTEGYERLWQQQDEAPSSGGDETNEIQPVASTSNLVEIGVKKGQPRSTCSKNSVVYLTGDSPNVLSSLEPGKTYVLGGIVDRNRYKKLCLDKAETQGVQHAQLPIGQYLPDLPTRKVLTVNQVYEIMVKWAETEDWAEALKSVMPERKLTEGKGHKRNGGDAANGGEEEDEADEVQDMEHSAKQEQEQPVSLVNANDKTPTEAAIVPTETS